MKFIKPLAVIIVGLIIGGFSAVYTVGALGRGDMIQNGSWTTSKSTGSKNAGPYMRAMIARVGLFALSNKEAVYFTTFDDRDGAQLSSQNCYEIQGGDLPARWWSLTAYGADHFLIAGVHDKYSISGLSVTPDASGQYRATIGGENGDILTADAGDYSLTLRLYMPEQSVLDDPGGLALPIIVNVGCS